MNLDDLRYMLFDVAVMVGPMGAVFIVPLVGIVLIAVPRCPRWAVRVAASLTAGVGLTWLGYWSLEYKAFGYHYEYQPVPGWLDVAIYTTLALCAGGVVALAATAIAAIVVSHRTRERAPASR